MRAAALVLMLSAVPVAAESFVLHWPLDCTLGQDCFIEDYVDDDPAPGQQRDFACGLNSRDAHKGTDLALISFDLMERGVAVRAAAPGTVLRLRDSMADDRLMTGVTDQNACGNAVLIDHGDGWQTLSCHMKRGSVAVTPGQTVATGDLLGEVGLSGQTNHPHLHLTVLHNGTEVDPFAPDAALPCGPQEVTLWADPPALYRPRARPGRVFRQGAGTGRGHFGHRAARQPRCDRTAGGLWPCRPWRTRRRAGAVSARPRWRGGV